MPMSEQPSAIRFNARSIRIRSENRSLKRQKITKK
jgi:hypothetical protein